MSTEYEKKIGALKENLEKAKNLKFRAEAKLEQLLKQKEEIISEINTLGLLPENLDMEIEKLQIDIEGLLKESSLLLPDLS